MSEEAFNRGVIQAIFFSGHTLCNAQFFEFIHIQRMSVMCRLTELKIQKQLNMLEKELKQKEETLFFEQMKIDTEADEQIRILQGLDGITIKTTQLFKVYVE